MKLSSDQRNKVPVELLIVLLFKLRQVPLQAGMLFITARAALMVASTSSSVCLRPVKPACRNRGHASPQGDQ